MIIVADNLHVVNPRVAKAVSELNPDPIIDMVLDCQKAGAQAIDINSGPLPKSPEKHFSFLVETVQGVSNLPLILDTINPIALAAGLKVCRNSAIINGFSIESSRLNNILPLAAAYDVDIIGYLLGANGEVLIDAEAMMATAVSVFEALRKAGLPPERLIIDPVIAPLSWDNGLCHNRAVLSVIQRLPDLLGTPVRTIAGISNLACGPMPTQRKIELEKAFVPMLAAVGLDMAMLNVFHGATVQMVGTCNALLEEMVFA
jgi:5-methyltetrahydrofolate corrinoid/iron sulfur protein methyltransferase